VSSRASHVWRSALAGGLHEPTAKRVRVVHGGHLVADTERALVVWEPRRVVPSYAVPVEDLRAELVPAPAAADGPDPDGFVVLHPGIPFRVHTAEGEPFAVRTPTDLVDAAAFQAADPALEGYVILDYFSFDEWYEEDERIVGHPRDPFKRIDVRRSSRHVRIELDGELLAESSRPTLLFETHLPVRYYLPPEDVRTDLLRATGTRTWCAYKGEARYWSLDLGGGTLEDLVWTYEQPLTDASDVVGQLAFFHERVDLVVDGIRGARPETEFTRPGWQSGTQR